ncbi:uncharacterized protein LOC126983357 [Eriocheir sinensis]|uniref:uncharacterized protein LOC126983357 n=1 Tax=Eriocheir sinensis TaxID=95602 RepID=UPI0021C578C3|nr:uncharacterized protein LOC126983357 [Eriocheir sinensis]
MLRVLCVALTVVAGMVCGHWSAAPLRAYPPNIALPPFMLSPSSGIHEGKFKRTSSTGTQQEVVWQRICSPRLSLVHRRQDAELKCEAVVPDGTKFTWYKGNQILQRPGVQQVSDVLQQMFEENTNEVAVSVEAAMAPSARLHVSSVVYIDCANEQDVADYTLEVTTPSNSVYMRNFTVALSGSRRRDGSTCGAAASRLESMPRIYQHAKEAWPRVGESLVLPCRAQGRRHQHTWYSGATSVTSTDLNYQKLDNGDLFIRTVGPDTPTAFVCQVSSDAEQPQNPDRIRTQITILSS